MRRLLIGTSPFLTARYPPRCSADMDVWAENILVDEGQLAGLIDWDRAYGAIRRSNLRCSITVASRSRRSGRGTDAPAIKTRKRKCVGYFTCYTKCRNICFTGQSAIGTQTGGWLSPPGVLHRPSSSRESALPDVPRFHSGTPGNLTGRRPAGRLACHGSWRRLWRRSCWTSVWRGKRTAGGTRGGMRGRVLPRPGPGCFGGAEPPGLATVSAVSRPQDTPAGPARAPSGS